MLRPTHVSGRRPSRARVARRGAALIEALIAFPFLFALLLGVSLMREWHAARQAVLTEARRCALLHAAAGCGREAPEGCEDLVGAGPSLGDDTPSTILLTNTRAAYAGSAFQLLELVPVLDDALSSLFGTTTRASAQRGVPRPGPHGEALVATGGMVLLCNERPTDVLKLAEQAVCGSPPIHAIDLFDLCGGR